MVERGKMRRCKNFNCDRLHGNYCCADCEQRTTCKNPCQNHPSRCGLEDKEPVKPSRWDGRRSP